MFRGVLCRTFPDVVAARRLTVSCTLPLLTRRAAPPGHLTDVGRQPPGIAQRLAQQKLDLHGRTTHLVAGPASQRVVDLGIQTDEDVFSLSHGGIGLSPSEVERSGIDHWLGRVVAAKHDHQVAHHRGLPLLAEIDHVTIPETLKGALNHANRSLDDVLTTAAACWRRSIACAISAA